MNFRTNIQLQKEENQIDYASKLLLIGSCFSENISKKPEGIEEALLKGKEYLK